MIQRLIRHLARRWIRGAYLDGFREGFAVSDRLHRMRKKP